MTYDVRDVYADIRLLADDADSEALARLLHQLDDEDVVHLLLRHLTVVSEDDHAHGRRRLSEHLNGVVVRTVPQALIVHLENSR